MFTWLRLMLIDIELAIGIDLIDVNFSILPGIIATAFQAWSQAQQPIYSDNKSWCVSHDGLDHGTDLSAGG